MNLKEECGSPTLKEESGSPTQDSEKELNIEVKEYERKPKPSFTCEICGKYFTEKKNLKIHIRGLHTKEKPFGCEECGKRFVASNQLKTHIRIHTGETPYCCKICLRRFKANTALNQHRRVHTGEKSLPCDICGKRVYDSNSLIIHIRTHTGEKPYKCKLCETSFARKYSLTMHQKVHTREKTFKCDICDKYFRCKSNLIVHKARHNRNKPMKVYKEKKERQFTIQELKQMKEEEGRTRLQPKENDKEEIDSPLCVINITNIKNNEIDADIDGEINSLYPFSAEVMNNDEINWQHEEEFNTGEDIYAEAVRYETEKYTHFDSKAVTVDDEIENDSISKEILESQSDLEYFESIEFFRDA